MLQDPSRIHSVVRVVLFLRSLERNFPCPNILPQYRYVEAIVVDCQRCQPQSVDLACLNLDLCAEQTIISHIWL